MSVLGLGSSQKRSVLGWVRRDGQNGNRREREREKGEPNCNVQWLHSLYFEYNRKLCHRVLPRVNMDYIHIPGLAHISLPLFFVLCFLRVAKKTRRKEKKVRERVGGGGKKRPSPFLWASFVCILTAFVKSWYILLFFKGTKQRKGRLSLSFQVIHKAC